MTASQSQRKIYNPGETEPEAEDHDGGYGEIPGDGPHHNRGDLERSHEPGYRESHQPGELLPDEAVSPDGAPVRKNIMSQEIVQHTSEQRGGKDQQAPTDISSAPMKTAHAAVVPHAASVEESCARRADDAAPPSPALVIHSDGNEKAVSRKIGRCP